MKTQELILSNMDQEYAKWSENMNEFTQLRDSENFNELFLRRKDIQKEKKSMREYLGQLNEKYENNIFDDIK
jgi:translation elongation factor P/translation initiation factor 5A